MDESGRASPYRGLEPFDEGDAPFFLGRDRETRLITASLFSAHYQCPAVRMERRTERVDRSSRGQLPPVRYDVKNRLRPPGKKELCKK